MFRSYFIGVLLVLVVSVSLLEAQSRRGRNGPRRRGPNDGLLFVLSSAEVQAELGLSMDQIELLSDLQLDLRYQRRGVGGSRRGGGSSFGRPRQGADRRPPREEAAQDQRQRTQQRQEQMNQTTEQIIATILEAPQLRRMNEIRLQLEGAPAIARPEIAKQLRVSPAQAQKIQEVREGGRDRLQVEIQILELLTRQQTEQWEKLKGKEFHFRQLTRPGSDGGERPRRPQRPQG